MKDYPWFKHYPEGIPHEINPDEYNSLIDLLDESFKKYGDSPAYENMGKSISFAETKKLSSNFAAYLQQELGLEKGDRIAIQSPNILQYPIALFGAMMAGLTIVNTNPLYTPPELKHQVNDSGAKVILVLANFAYNLEKILPETSIEHVIVTEIGDLIGGFKGALTNFVVKNVKKMVPAYSIPNAIKFKDAINKGAKLTLNKMEMSSDDIAFLQYTGGTTGVSKGAMLTHRNVIANMIQVNTWIGISLEDNKETVITALPLYHIFALTINCLIMFRMGAKNVLITNPRDMDGFVKELSKHKFSVITGVNTLYNGLLNHPKFSSLDFSNLKSSVGGGMAVQKVVAEKWKDVTGVPIIEGYGLTETSPVLTTNPPDGNERLGTIGLPMPSTEIIILDDDNKEVAVGQPGEICGRGPQVMKGYWQRQEATDEVFFEDWFKTGDIGIMDEDGFTKIVDRKKEMVLVSGFNVYPNEVENCLASHPKVLEVGVIGVPDAKSNEAVKVFIVKKDASLTEDEIRAYSKENLTPYKCPKYIEFIDELPKSNVGKILRRILRENDAKVNKYI
jgi:long-chain acyl-CoA synthetase